MGGGRGAGRVAGREAGDAVYGIYHAGGLAEVAQDQRAGAGQWAYLGTWAFDPAGSPLVVLAGGSDGTLSADALRFVGAGPAPAALRFVHSDHLGTPQKLTDNAGALVWDRIQTPFGLDHSVTGAAATPVRFPGQYADGESSLHYNYFRDYDPSLGRYIQSDPIGLAGGLNTYGYAGGNPLGYADPYGLRATTMGGFGLIAGAGRALAMALCRASGSGTAADAAVSLIFGAAFASAYAVSGPGGVSNESTPGESGQSGGGGAGENGESQGDSKSPPTPIPDTMGTPGGGQNGGEEEPELPEVKKAVNTNNERFRHAVDQAVEREVFPNKEAATQGLKNLSKDITRSGWPRGTIPDTRSADRVLVPVGNRGLAVYRVGKNGTARIRTVLNVR